MTRHIVLGNGTLLVNIDKWLQVRDFYYPHPGQENHLLGHAHRVGVFVGGKLSWVNEDSWLRKLSYVDDTLISESLASNAAMECSLKFNDCVDCSKDVFLRKLTLSNDSGSERDFTVFFHHDFHLYGDGVGDTTGYDPVRNSVFHYKRRRYFLISVVQAGSRRSNIFEYSVGLSDSGGTLNDAYDGALGKIPIAQGSVDSICSVKALLKPHSSAVFYYFICCGRSFDDVNALQSYVLDKTPEEFFRETDVCWRGYCGKAKKLHFADLSHEEVDLFKRSLLITRTQIDKHGAILAANDSDNVQFNKDTYSYVWHRDGAFAALALQRAGYFELAENFYLFCSRVIERNKREGYFLHKYNPDGSLGSSWHPWIKDEKPQLPIQEDGSALPVYALWDYYVRTGEKKFVRDMYEKFAKPAAEFMCGYVYKGLPRESYDLWEERQGILTFTCNAVCAGLNAAANLAKEFRDKDYKRYAAAAAKVHASVARHLYSKMQGRFVRMTNLVNGKFVADLTVDSSLYANFALCGFKPDDKRVIGTMKAIEKYLWVKTGIGGVARYYSDQYHKNSNDFETVPGNPWFICTLWLAKWYIAIAKSLEDLKKPRELIRWVVEHALPTGVLPEQIHPYSGEPLSVAPLTWSHSEYVDTVLDYSAKYKALSSVNVKIKKKN
ncbi:glycoside hydrolase family 15 protein [Candidatus Woesearchaeota archaeon]|nr:glycoside hydrolase family 15 protein [Candidatus Woesearchaeota archaeon]